MQPANRRDAEFTEFVETRIHHLRRIAVAVCGDSYRAEDVLQNALTKLYVAWPHVRRDGTEEAYTRRIIVRADIDDRRRPWRRRESSLPDTLDPPSRAALDTADRLTLYDALRALPPMQRKVVILRHWLGLSVADTAADLRLATGTVKAYTSRGLETLRHHLDDSHQTAPDHGTSVAGSSPEQLPHHPQTQTTRTAVRS